MRQFSVIIPTHNEMKTGWLEKILNRLKDYSNFELIVVDNNSSDGTLDLLKRFPVKVLPSSSHLRSVRLNQGITAAKNEWLLLHHPRSLIAKEGLEFLSKEDLPEWGAFTHRFDDDHPLLKFTSWYSNHIRGDKNHIYYLDHCLFLKKGLFPPEDSSPVPEVSIFEDTELCLKLRKIARTQRLPFESLTSSVRFKKNGFYFQALMNQIMKVGYHLGISDETMNRIYEKGLSLNSKY